jgi:ring-1,2-phenylacetyl-CoA epoxidase subunit PaaC
MKDQLYQYVLRLADDALIMSYRMGEWCSNGPMLEEDLAMTNMALDYIGRAEALLEYASHLKDDGSSADDLAYRRPEREFYNHLICEQVNGDFAHTMLRQYLIASYELNYYSELCKSNDSQLAAIAMKAIKEIKYHHQHCRDWVIRLGDGTELSNQKTQIALNQLWMFTGELFENDEIDTYMMDMGIAPNPNHFKSLWDESINQCFILANIHIPNVNFQQTGSKQGIHSEQLGHILSVMQYLPRAYPNAKWSI